MKTIPCLKVVILGAPEVGKSAVTVRFLTKRFIGEYSSGTDCTYQTIYRSEGNALTVDMVDCTSHWDGSSHREVDAYVIVYSVTDSESLNHAHALLHTLHTTTTTTTNPTTTTSTTTTQQRPLLLLLGNKTDLQHLRQVSHDDVTRMIRHYPGCRHHEASAADSGCGAVQGPLQELLTECAAERRRRRRGQRGQGGGGMECGGQEEGEGVGEGEQHKKRKRSWLLGHVSRRLGRVFRRKSLDDFFPARRSSSASTSRVADNFNRRSV